MLILTATMPYRKAIPPQTTKVPAENMVIKAERPDNHHEEERPAAKKSAEFFIFLERIKLTRIFPPM
jgi:hypothetical protein